VTRKYVFKINGYRPETLPFDRLLEYYQQLAKLFGNAEDIRLSEIFESSHASALRIEESATATVANRFAAYEAGNPPADMERARAALDRMLADDATSGSLENDRGDVVVQFAGKAETDERALEVVESGSIVGHLYSWTLNKTGVNIRIEMPGRKKINCNISTELALKIRQHLKEDVRLFGRGTWRRESGGWVPVAFSVNDFEPLEQVSLREAVQRLRSLDVTWPADPLAEITAMNEEPGRLQ
jgi:hypothetical protein